MLRLLLLIACSSTAFALVPVKAVDCSNSPNKILHFDNYHVEQDPVLIPGNNSVDIDVHVLKPISGNHYKVTLSVTRKVLFGWVIVPCFQDPSQNTCTFELCDILSGRSYNNTNHCPDEILASTPDFPCACPFQPGTYHLNPTKIVIDHLSTALQFLAQGDYQAHVTITDTNTNEEVFCYNAQVSTKSSQCSGIQCIIG
ncbi:GM2 ganglioside activator [Mactra antiquata]